MTLQFKLEQEMKNFAWDDKWILLVVTCPLLRRAETEEINY